MLQLANREDTVLTANIEIKTGSAEGLLIICMPLTALESFLQEKSGRLVSGNRSRSEDRISTRSRVELCIRQVSLPVSARMRPFGVSAEVLAGLEEGQVILTGHHAETGVELHISGLARFEGRVGQHHGHYGVRIAGHSDGANTRQPKGRLLP
jgi:flagellar motor switch protein FliM